VSGCVLMFSMVFILCVDMFSRVYQLYLICGRVFVMRLCLIPLSEYVCVCFSSACWWILQPNL
jgi:hypothetical protein